MAEKKIVELVHFSDNTGISKSFVSESDNNSNLMEVLS